jgi:hypothetical protein
LSWAASLLSHAGSRRGPAGTPSILQIQSAWGRIAARLYGTSRGSPTIGGALIERVLIRERTSIACAEPIPKRRRTVRAT